METNLKVDGATHQQVWRHTYGQPRGFDARFVLQILCQNLNIVPRSQLCSPISWVKSALRYIHDECYGVALDAEGNYLIIGGWAAFFLPFCLENQIESKSEKQLDETGAGSQLCLLHFFSHTCFRSGDEYEYEETNADGWSSDTWVRNLFDILPSRFLLGETFENAPLFYWLPSLVFFIDFQVSYLVVISPSGETVFSGVFGDKEGNNAGMWRQIRLIEVCNSCFDNF